MRNLLFFCFLFCAIAGSGQGNQDNERIVNLFVQEWLSSAGSEDCALKYLEIHASYLQDSEKKRFFFEWFSLFSKTIHEEIIKNNGKYQIIPHQNNQENKIIKEFNLITDDYAEVFYLVANNKVVTSIILKDGKIISYCPMLNQGSKINRAWFINKPIK